MKTEGKKKQNLVESCEEAQFQENYRENMEKLILSLYKS